MPVVVVVALVRFSLGGAGGRCVRLVSVEDIPKASGSFDMESRGGLLLKRRFAELK